MVTLACLPLLVLDVLQGSSTSGAAPSDSSSESSLVLAVVPSTEEPSTTSSTVALVVPDPEPTTTIGPAVTIAPVVEQTPTTTVPRPVATAAPVVQSDAEFLACVRRRESNNDYTASDPTGTFLGAYQIYQGGWDSIAARIGRNDLIGVAPNDASPSDQDIIAEAMLQVHGRSPWGSGCR